MTLKSEDTLSKSSIACKIPTGIAAKRIAGLHPVAGDPEILLRSDLCLGDLLLETLVADTGVTVKALATALSLGLIDGEVVAKSDLGKLPRFLFT